MKIVLIGAGNLATNLGKALVASGNEIVQVYSRTMESASLLASAVGSVPTDSLELISNDADLYVFSVKDSVLESLIPVICKGREGKTFCHTAGSMPMDVFRGYADHYGVFYPMQTFSKEKDVCFREIPCFLESNDESSRLVIEKAASSVSDSICWLSSDDRKYLHLSAVFACNFVNHCYAMASDILEQHGIPFSVMLPLVDETARKVHSLPPAEAQTGPAVRYDENIIRAQADLLSDSPAVRDLYERMSMSIHAKALNKKQ